MGLVVHRNRLAGDPTGLRDVVRWSGRMRWGAVVVVIGSLLTGCEPRHATPQMEVDTHFWIRVLVLEGATHCRIEAPSPLTVSSVHQNEPIQVVQDGPDARHSLLEIAVQKGRLQVGERVFEPGDEVEIRPAAPHVLRVDGTVYRGTIHLVLDRDGRRLDAVNGVPLEPYLAGVIGAEMPFYWEPQAWKAQAIAARTYAWFIKERFGVKRHWDVGRTEGHQVYRGVAAESAQVWTAVNETAGQVLTAEMEGKQVVFPSYYSAICGGHTEDSKAVFGETYAPLQGVACPYCRDAARVDQFYWPMVQMGNREVTTRLEKHYPALKALGRVARIEPSRQSDYDGFSRVTQFRLVGTNGKAETVRAEDLRLALDPSGRKIQSTCFRLLDKGDRWMFLAGRGWGHGVGMCQTGAEGMARRGHKAEQILRYYYPGSQIIPLY
jgi:stage II sporulation protein D